MRKKKKKRRKSQYEASYPKTLNTPGTWGSELPSLPCFSKPFSLPDHRPSLAQGRLGPAAPFPTMHSVFIKLS